MTREYEDFANRHLHVIGRNGSEWMCRCPFHENEGTAAMQFNVDRGLFVCFSCGAGGGMRALARHFGTSYVDRGVDVDELLHTLTLLRSKNHGEKPVPVLPESTLSRYDFPTDYWGPCPRHCIAYEYGRCKNHRGFTPRTIKRFDLGFDPLRNTAVIPLRNDHGGLIGVVRRYLDPDVEFRYRYPKGFKRTNNLFGAWRAFRTDSDLGVMVEGATDSLNVWQAGYMGLGQYGSSLNPAQVTILRKLGLREVVLFYDNDKAGRKAARQAQGIKHRLDNNRLVQFYDPDTDLTRDFWVSVAPYKGLHRRDPGGLRIDEIRYAVEHRIPVI